MSQQIRRKANKAIVGTKLCLSVPPVLHQYKHDSLMATRRRTSRQVPSLQCETACVGEPCGERLTLRAGEESEGLIATLANSNTITVPAKQECTICLDGYKENEDVWRVEPCGHIFHYSCIQSVGLIAIIHDCDKLIHY
jgi:hypothetical protein